MNWWINYNTDDHGTCFFRVFAYIYVLHMFIYIYRVQRRPSPPPPKGMGVQSCFLWLPPPVACGGGVFGMLVMGGMYVWMDWWMDGWMDVQNYTLLQYCYQWTITALAECCYHNACVKCRRLELRYNWSRGKQLKLTDWTIAVNNTLETLHGSGAVILATIQVSS